MIQLVLAQAILEFVKMVLKFLASIIPVSLLGMVVIMILTLACIVSGIGGTFLFYIILVFYIKALLTYDPVKAAQEARLQEQQAMEMNQMTE